MILLQGYVIKEMVYENNRIRLYRGCMEKKQIPVLIEVLKEEASNPLEISKLIYEYEIARVLKIEGVMEPIKLENIGNYFAMIMEDVGAVTLREYIKNRPLEVPIFLDIAIQLAEILGRLHKNGIIHRDLNVDNIFVNPDTGITKITGFNNAVLFSVKSMDSSVLDALSNTIVHGTAGENAWLEETIDYRCDYFSLGKVFLEILSGHCSAGPTGFNEYPDYSFYKINPEIPVAIRDIIMKLLSQNPDDGYQSAYGIIKDLDECRRQWNLTGKIEPFIPGRMDISLRFELPHRLYGREKEAKILKSAFKRACNGQGELIIISGYAGVGKTALLN
ncbi:MAG: protein kinase [Clostridiaceae bacterium]|nr:protein kinase [Clostridiaceae bacterium]